MKTTTYNKSEIFKNAWAIVKSTGETISNALKRAWAIAKGEDTTSNVKYILSILDKACEKEGCIAYTRVWEKGSYSRTYLKMYNKKGRETSFGYIDNTTGEYINRDKRNKFTNLYNYA